MAAFTYPGVYIEEISSGQHTISGVATSIAAFIGWSNQGPAGVPTMVESWPEYQAQFGGLIPGVPLGYAVYQFFLNGGAQAYILRMVATAADPGGVTAAATASSEIGGLAVSANSPGGWGNNIGVAISNVATVGLFQTFNLQVTDAAGKVLESYTKLSTNLTDPQYAVTAINNDSNYLTFPASGWTTLPTVSNTSTTTGFTVKGSVTSGVFTVGETVKQDTSAASATVVSVSGGTLTVGPITGSVTDGTDVWRGQSSTAVFTPVTPHVAPAAITTPVVAINGGGGTVTSGVDGTVLAPNSAAFETELISTTTGYASLANVPIFNILCVPGENAAGIVPDLLQFCLENRAFLIVDSAQTASMTTLATNGPSDSGGTAYSSNNKSYGGFYYPWIQAPDPAAGFRPAYFPPCGYVAGAFAETDANRGVWKAPAGIQASLSGSLGLQTVLTDAQNGGLNQVAVNCLRQFRIYGNVIWGARTMDGADAEGSQWKYIPVRRLAMFLESSLYQGTQWVVFEPNDETLWGQVRLSVGTFMQGLFLKGAFAGTTPQQAYFVKCDGDNNPDSSVALGVVNIMVGFAPVDPAEFVVIQITQILNS